VASGVVAAGMLGTIGRPAIAEQMDDWRLLPRNERTTELYFTNIHDMPAQQNPQLVAFAVRNVEHHTVTYRYVLTVQPDNTNVERQVGTGTLTLAHGQSADIQKSFTVLPLGIHVFVKVTLSYKGMNVGARVASKQTQSIHYWLATSASAARKEKL